MLIKKMALWAGVLLVATTGSHAFAADNAAQSPTTSYQGFQSGDILVRGRMLAFLPNTNSEVAPVGGHVTASNSLEPEVDFSYFFTPNVAVEAIAALTRHHLVDKDSSAKNVDLGHTTLLPPTLTAQYHFLSKEVISPYAGAGVNYTIFFDSKSQAGSAAHSINYKNSFGTAIQAGADYHMQGSWYANIDIKHIFLSTTAKINGGAIVGAVKLDPTVVGLGIGYKF